MDDANVNQVHFNSVVHDCDLELYNISLLTSLAVHVRHNDTHYYDKMFKSNNLSSQ